MNLKTKRRLKLMLVSFTTIFLILELSGLKCRFYERDYFAEFDYPTFGDITELVDEFIETSKGATFNNHDYGFKLLNDGKCDVEEGKLRLVYVVKSSVDHFERRKAIRRTWGYEGRFSDVPIRTVFLVGSTADVGLQSEIETEFGNHGDVIQGDFVDGYYNNTVKTLMGLRWAAEHCPDARFFMFVDDDYYVSTRNLLRFLRNPANYPKYLEDPTVDFDDVREQNLHNRKLNQLVDFDLPDDVVLFAGYVFFVRPQRHYFGKWSLSVQDYPFDRYPPYVTAGAYVLSNEALRRFYAATFFVEKFIFDDVYLGIVAKKLGVEPFHCPEFWMYRKYPYRVETFRYAVASHEFSDPKELEKIWTEQKHAGNA